MRICRFFAQAVTYITSDNILHERESSHVVSGECIKEMSYVTDYYSVAEYVIIGHFQQNILLF